MPSRDVFVSTLSISSRAFGFSSSRRRIRFIKAVIPLTSAMNWTSERAVSETFLSGGSPIFRRISDMSPFVPEYAALRFVASGFGSLCRTVMPRS